MSCEIECQVQNLTPGVDVCNTKSSLVSTFLVSSHTDNTLFSLVKGSELPKLDQSRSTGARGPVAQQLARRWPSQSSHTVPLHEFSCKFQWFSERKKLRLLASPLSARRPICKLEHRQPRSPGPPVGHLHVGCPLCKAALVAQLSAVSWCGRSSSLPLTRPALEHAGSTTSGSASLSRGSLSDIQPLVCTVTCN